MDTKETPPSESALREEKILKFWKENNIFEKTLAKESPQGDFIFYEGPPTANAAPALHHLEARAFKDVIPRYKTMRGFRVSRKGGWDTHGLPVELQIEKKLGLKSKKEIEQYGIAAFNRYCRESVWEYIDVWNTFTERIGYWVDEKHPYVTYHNSYIESLWNIVAHVHDRSLLYKDYKVVPWCPRCGTALSSHELAQGYQDVTDLSVYVKFKVIGQEHMYFLAWTTTPWTLPGNVGLAVGADIDYVKAKVNGDVLIVAKERISVLGEGYEIVEEMKGAALVGLEYEPLYPFLRDLATGEAKEKIPNAWKVYPADFVTTTDGTGIVHTAVMYGQEDFDLGTKVGLPKFHLVQPDGTFVPGTGFLEGAYVRNEDTTVAIIKDLAGRSLLFKKEKHTHSYPHCWRCKTALIYYARDSWYIGMSTLRSALQSENEKINWEPSHIKEGRFGEWLREAKDWAISRERYWGTPLPVWENASGRVIVDSLATLASLAKKSGNTYIGIRHGEAEHNVLGVWSSQPDAPHHLTEKGKAEVAHTADGLRGTKVDLIVASPFVRTKETAEVLAQTLGVSSEHIVYDARLGEWNVGEYDGTAMEEYFGARRGSADPYTFEIKGAESYRRIIQRAGEVLYDLEKKYAGKTIAIVSHGAVLRALHLVSQGISQENEEVLRKQFNNYALGESRPIAFVPLPHNEFFELDLHRPYIDDIELVDKEGNGLVRAKEVMDVWFDSGSMPFAQDADTRAAGESFDDLYARVPYPADFISEAIDQTRGWFYTLLSVGVLMGRGTPYKNVICLGHILDKEGKKMSKSVGNIVNPWEEIARYGVDALRLWMYSVNQPGDSKNYDPKTVDEIVKKVFNPLTNIYMLFSTYEKGVERIDPRRSANILDQWMISRLDQLVGQSTEALDNFKLFEPVRLLRDIIQDFSTWYIRRSRERLKSAGTDASEAVSVTEYVLTELAKFLAPFAPFYAEWLYGEVTKGSGKESVHLEQWSQALSPNEELLRDMEAVRHVVSEALELRQKAGIKVRQPLATLKVKKGTMKESEAYCSIVSDEVNVKTVSFDDSIEAAVWLDTAVTDELREEGLAREIIRAIQDVRKEEGMSPTEPIILTVNLSEHLRSVFNIHTDMISRPTLAKEIIFSQEKQAHEALIEGETMTIGIAR